MTSVCIILSTRFTVFMIHCVYGPLCIYIYIIHFMYGSLHKLLTMCMVHCGYGLLGVWSTVLCLWLTVCLHGSTHIKPFIFDSYICDIHMKYCTENSQIIFIMYILLGYIQS